ncbi:MAG: hypothetical protein LBU18_05455 [Treponema sp.]|jgi:hypothetical protein|nr:hypothetical protein [Treponema sp.]
MLVPLIIAAAGLILSGFSFLFCFAYMKRRTGKERLLAELSDEIAGLIRDVNEITNRDVLLVEDRVKTLRSLLEDTDRRIALLAGEVSHLKAQDDVYVELGRLRSPAAGLDGEKSGNPNPPPEEKKKPRPPAQTYSPRIVRSSAQIAPKAPPFTEQAAELYRAGFSPELIALRLGAALSEVELAIALAVGKRPGTHGTSGP